MSYKIAPKKTLSEKEQMYIAHFITNGDREAAFAYAGFKPNGKGTNANMNKFHRDLYGNIEVAVRDRIGEHVPKAINAVAHLMECSESDAVKLNAAKDLLSRAGTDPTTRQEVETTTKVSDLTDEEITHKITELTEELKTGGKGTVYPN